MIDRLRAFLKRPSSALVVCGYSFRDEHLNANLIQGLQGNPTAAIFALVHGQLASYPVAIRLAATRGNLSLLAEDAGVIGMKQEPWIEKEGAEVESPSVAVEWMSKDPEGTNEVKQASFKLGDFGRFGAFLGELIGSEGSRQKEQDAG